MRSSKDGSSHGKLKGKNFFFKLTRKRQRNAQVFVGGLVVIMLIMILVGSLFCMFAALTVCKELSSIQ